MEYIKNLVKLSVALFLFAACSGGSGGYIFPENDEPKTEEPTHEIKFAVDENPYALAMANHIQEMKVFKSKKLQLSQCYDWGVKLNNYMWGGLLFGAEVDADNPNAVEYINSFNDKENEIGAKYQSAFSHLLNEDSCPFSIPQNEEQLRFQTSLDSYLEYMEKMKLGAQYGYVTLRERNAKQGRTVMGFIIDVRSRYSKYSDIRLTFAELYHGKDDKKEYYNLEVGQFLMALAYSRNWVMREFEKLDKNDPLYEHFSEKIYGFVAIIAELHLSDKYTIEDLRFIETKAIELYEMADEAFTEALEVEKTLSAN